MNLSQSDVQKLLADRSTTTKIEVLNKISAQYNDVSENMLNQTQAALVEDIYRQLAKTGEVEVRAALAENLKDSVTVPHDIALKLAKDVDTVAAPILQSSQVLTEADLLDIIESASANHHLAIAQRLQVSTTISNALVDTRNEAVFDKLLKNFGAEINQDSYEKIVNRSSNNESIVRSMIEKGTLPVTVTEKLLQQISQDVRQKLNGKYEIAFHNKALKQDMEMRLEQATTKMMGMRSSDAQIKKLLKDLSDSGKLPPFSALAMGNYGMFEISLSRLARIPLYNVRILLNDGNEKSFRALYQKAHLPEILADAMLIAVRAVQMLEASFAHAKLKMLSYPAADIIERMEIVAKDKKIDYLDFMISLIQHQAKG